MTNKGERAQQVESDPSEAILEDTASAPASSGLAGEQDADTLAVDPNELSLLRHLRRRYDPAAMKLLRKLRADR